jgi:hypothetical protein
MRRYTVQVDPPVINWHNPGEQIHWHWSVEARSEAEALAIVQSGYCKGMPARIVVPF